MPDPAHEGSQTASGSPTLSSDRRILDIDEALRDLEAVSPLAGRHGFLRDPNRAIQAPQHSLSAIGTLNIGTIVHAMPQLAWYKVQMGTAGGWIAATHLAGSGLVPPGPGPTSVLPPASQVLVYQKRGLPYGLILGVVPVPIMDGGILCPDWLVQGGRSGLKREAAHKYPIQNLFHEGGVLNFSANRPMDGTAFELGWITPTGIAFMIDDAETYLRVNEMCGLFLNLFDSHTRLSGVQLDIMSAVHEEMARDDEGEAHLFRGVAAYPWEALGLYAPGTAFTQQQSPKDVQYSGFKAATDLPDGKEDLQPVYRYAEYGGYLGQGHYRTVMKPAKDAGLRRYQDTEPDEGLFSESIALDGSYTVRSAKSIILAKRCKIPVPKQLKLPEDGFGDDAQAGHGEYKFSSLFGKGQDHKIGDLQPAGDILSMRKAAAVMDVLAYYTNWKPLHPFHYHHGDYAIAQESEQNAHFDRSQDHLDFSVLNSQAYLPDPLAKKIKIDHRYNDVSYYQRESFIVMHDDGTVQIGGGGGETITLGGGHIDMSAPGDLRLVFGRQVLVLSKEAIIRALGSVDVSSSEKDVRLKAGGNMQLRANGMLLESSASGTQQDYQNKIGEDVVSSGIVLRSPQSICAVLAGEIYARTGGESMASGPITFDANQGQAAIQFYGSDVGMFTSGAFSILSGPVGDNSNVKKAYYFGEHVAILDADVTIRGSTTASKGVTVEGDILSTGSIATTGVMADRDGTVSKAPASLGDQIRRQVEEATQQSDDQRKQGTTTHQQSIVSEFYASDRIGSDAILQAIGFSYRDSDDELQYHVQNLKWPEMRWQAMVRFGGATGGGVWVEEPVLYQGRQLYPWPGHKKWLDEPVFLRLTESRLYDYQAGQCLDRGPLYENPSIANWDTVSMADGFTII